MPTPRQLRVLTLNLHKGFSAGNRRFVLPELREAVRAENADLVILQEVQGEHAEKKLRHPEWPEAPQYEYLADTLWPEFAYGRNAVYTQGHHGNAILSKYPIVSQENLDISAHPVESRGLLHCEMISPESGDTFHVLCVHLGLLGPFRTRQYGSIRDRVRSRIAPDAPLILAGDFNDWNNRAGRELETLGLREAFETTHGRPARTFPAFLPLLPLDRIYLRGFEVAGTHCLSAGPWSRLSDHAALAATLSWPRGANA